MLSRTGHAVRNGTNEENRAVPIRTLLQGETTYVVNIVIISC